MSKSSRRPQQLYTIIMWLLSVVFAGFLIGLGSLIIADLPKFDQQSTVQDFVDIRKMSPIDGSITVANRKIKSIRRNSEDAEVKLKSATADYQNGKASLDNWLKTRTATESAAQNPAVIKRTRTVEAFKQAERNALRNLEDINTEATQAQRQISDLKRQRADLLSAARPKYMKITESQRAARIPFAPGTNPAFTNYWRLVTGQKTQERLLATIPWFCYICAICILCRACPLPSFLRWVCPLRRWHNVNFRSRAFHHSRHALIP